MALGPNDGKVIEYYIKETVKREISDDRIKKIVEDCLKDMNPTNTIDAKNIYLCSYIDENNNRRVGFFKREDVFHSLKGLNYNYYYNIYTGIDSNYVGIFSVSTDPTHKERWMDYGEELLDGKYIVNCKMKGCLGNFDKFRQRWRKENNISSPYDASVTNMEELTMIRDYMKEYYQSNNKVR